MTTHDDTPDIDEILELERLATEEVKLAEEAHAIHERREQIKGRLRALLGEGTHKVGPFQVQVRPGARRINTQAIVQAYPPAQHPDLYAPAVDVTAVRRRVAPADLEQYQTQGAPTVVVR